MPPPESVRISTRRRRRRGSWASASRVTSMCSAAVFDPALPGRSTMASGFPGRRRRRGQRTRPGGGTRRSSSTSGPPAPSPSARSRSWHRYRPGSAPPSAPGASSPASSQARSRAAARAARIAFSARGASAASGGDQPGDHRVGGHRPGQLRLGAQHRDIGQAVTAQRQRHGQVSDDLPGVMHRPRRPPPGQPVRQAFAQAGDPERLGQQQPRPGTRSPSRQQTR